VAGALMVLAAILMTGWLPKRTLIGLASGPSLLSRVGGRLLRSTTAGNKLALGMVLGLLPCGMVYAALLKALDAGSAAGGAATMLAFGLGTSGALIGVGMFSTAITARFGKYANVLAAVSVAFTGAFLLYRGLIASTPGGVAPSCHGHS
jgi:sulfite exporter TauE/SafE